MTKTFEAELRSKGPGGAWTYLAIPFDVLAAFGTRARVAVSGTINGFAFQNSLMPEGDGTHSMMVSKELQAGAGAVAGDVVTVVLQRDEQQRVVSVPRELEAALEQSPAAAATFAAMSYSQKKEYADWISSAKQQATQESRTAKAIQMLAEGKKRLR